MKIDLITSALPELSDPVATPDSSDSLKAAAVLMLLHKVDSDWQLLFTKRATHLKSHAGQVSFPGGSFETDDSHMLETAVRETEEEIGISRKHLRIISQLNQHETITGFRIYPYIAVINELPELTIDTGEVAEVFSVPLHFLLDKNNQQPETALFRGKNHIYYKIIWQNKIIWGATARMVVDFSKYLE